MTNGAKSTTRTGKPGPDLESMRAKYREERNKRIRPDANNQYREVIGEFSHYIDDPYADPDFTRDALEDEVEILIIGGGFGGLLVGARLREAGIENIRIIEKGGDFGGTWYWNRYPGAQCDVESYIYFPLLEELKYIPTQKYAFAPEILSHAQAIARHYDLYADVCFQTQVTALEWNDSTNRLLRPMARPIDKSLYPMTNQQLRLRSTNTTRTASTTPRDSST